MGTGAWEKSESIEVCICIPHNRPVSMEWATSFKRLRHPPAMYHLSRNLPLDISRDELVKNVFKHNAKWVFFLDSDIIIPVGLEDIIFRLMSHNLPIVSALYFTRTFPTHEAMWRLITPEERKTAEKQRNEEKKKNREYDPLKELEAKGIDRNKVEFITEKMDIGKFAPITEYKHGEVVKADVIGMGCCLIHRRVFETIPRPWFFWTHGREDYLKCPHCGKIIVDDELMNISEDFYFCMKAKKYGIDIWVDTGLVVEHEVELKATREGEEQVVRTPLARPRI